MQLSHSFRTQSAYDACDRNMPHGREGFSKAQSRLERGIAESDAADMFRVSQRSVYGDDKRAVFPQRDFFQGILQIDGVNRAGQCAQDGHRAQRSFFQLVADERPQAVAGRAVASDAENEDRAAGRRQAPELGGKAAAGKSLSGRMIIYLMFHGRFSEVLSFFQSVASFIRG